MPLAQVLPPSTVVHRVAPPAEHEPAATRQARLLSRATIMVCSGAVAGVTDCVGDGLPEATVDSKDGYAELTGLVSMPTRDLRCQAAMSGPQGTDDSGQGIDNL